MLRLASQKVFWLELLPGCYGIPEPTPDQIAKATVDPQTIDTVLIPGSVFDLGGGRLGYGGGYYAMGGGRAFNANAVFAWPGAEICAMSIEGAVAVAYRKHYEAADKPAVARQAMIDDIRAQTGALHAAEDFGIDDVIDPRCTRRLLIETFSACAPRRPDHSPPRRRSISPI